MVLRVNKHNFCFIVIEFQLVYVHPTTYISDSVLYAQPCNIDITTFECRAEYHQHRNDKRYHDYVLSQQVVQCTIDTKWDLEQSPAERPQSVDDFVSLISTN